MRSGRDRRGLPWTRLRSYKKIDAQNARLRELIRDTVDRGAWRARWISPSMPYYNLTGALADLAKCGLSPSMVYE
jgi:hypothetical protein